MNPSFSANCFANSILIVAHPDDEILWFSSIVNQVDIIIVCYSHSDLFPHLRAGREKSIAEYPLKRLICLRLCEAPVFDNQNWILPKTDRYGLLVPEANPGKRQYVRNYYQLKNIFKGILDGFTNVFTHSPWGEYGHEEHVQLSLIIQELQREFGFRLWFPSYCSNKSFPLMFSFFPRLAAERLVLKTNAELAQEIMTIYQRNSCWTWDKDTKWPPEEAFIRLLESAQGNRKYYITVPVNAIRIPLFKNGKKRTVSWETRALNVIKRLAQRCRIA